jgi:hypothetical protein
MNLDLANRVQHKPAFRRRLAARPIEEKLALLDALRLRALAIRSATRFGCGVRALAVGSEDVVLDDAKENK